MDARKSSRVRWLDYVKVIACILVVLGHFFQSMTKAGILPVNDLYQWFNTTIYYFHVELFFICSGYLYQRFSKVNSVRSWILNVRKKAVALGVPYIAFTTVTWLLKTVFSDSVNDQIGGLWTTLLLKPTSPYWYLYALFFIFLVMPTFGGTREATIGLGIAFAAKLIACAWGDHITINAFAYLLADLIWFVLGMCIECYDIRLTGRKRGAEIVGVVFLLLSIWVFYFGIENRLVTSAIGVLACASIIMLTAENEEVIGKCWLIRLLSHYTMPIYLMHTLFAAPTRSLLLRLGVTNSIVHVVIGICISLAGPMIAARIMELLKYPEFLIYPEKVVRGNSKVH